jgi:KDO2-lipid IV(A) lauroyltransferase
MGLGLLWLSAKLLSYPMALSLGRRLGGLIHHWSNRRRRIAEINIDLCFPGLTPAERKTMVREHFEFLGIGILLSGFAWWASDRKLKPLCHIKGKEYLDAALEQGRGALLLSPHFTTPDLLGRMMSYHYAVASLYRPHENPVIEQTFQHNRQRCAEEMIPRDQIRTILRALKRNLPVWYAPDQSFKGRKSILVPFFGIPAATNPATSDLARLSRAPVFPYCGYLLPGKEGFQIVIEPPLDDFPSGDTEADTTRTNLVLEEMIRQAPSQYLWTHRRFKKRKVLPDPY